MKRFLLFVAIVLALSVNAMAQQCNVECICPDSDQNRHADQINEKLQVGQHAVLCPSTTWHIRNTIWFNPYYSNTYLLTYGNPRDNTRAYLFADSPTDIHTGGPLDLLIGMAVFDQNGAIACNFCQIRNIRVDGNRDAYGWVGGGQGMVSAGGSADGQI